MNYGEIVAALCLSAILFGVLMWYISMRPQKKAGFLKWTFLGMFLVGTIMYCIIHYFGLEKSGYEAWWFKIPYIAMRSVIDVGTMFYGRASTDVFNNLPAAQNPFIVLAFWLVHMAIFYTAASALLIRFGNNFLRWVKVKIAKFLNFDINIIFGINPDSIAFGRNIADKKRHILIYVDSSVSEDYESYIRDLGGIIYSSSEALKASTALLSEINIKPRNKKLRLYAMSDDYDKNIEYARMMLESLEVKKIPPEQTELLLLGTDEMKGMIFQANTEHYGYGDVISFDEYEMSARLLIHEYPICNAIKFREDGRAAENVEVLIVGFGRMGHEVLRKVIANGQFEGSNFHFTVFDPKYKEREGFVKSQYPLMFSNYEYQFEPQDGRSGQIFDFIKENASNLKYIVICIEDRDSARSMAIRMVDRLQAMKCPMNVYTCDPKSVRCYSHDVKECRTHWLYDSELLCSGKIDSYAIELNHCYMELYRNGSGNVSAAEDWRNCDYFGRMSSRASVDYLIPLIKRVMTNPAGLTHEQRENISRSEHLRWCAFHYTFGFDVMDMSEFLQRVKAWKKETDETGKSSIKLTKDMENKTHVCLVEWDMLDEISRAENEITHGTRDYKENDRKNVDMVIELVG